MVKVTPATRDEIKEFNLKEWHDVDIEHYGKPVEWNGESFIFKAEENGNIVGTITGKHESGIVYINGLLVAKSVRGKGIGKRLMQQAIKFGKKKRAHKIHLQTGKDWEAAKFYESLGLKKIAELPNHHFHKDFVIYEKLI